MAYSPTTDFISLERLSSAGVGFERMPGLDFVVSALARAGLIRLSVSATAPTTNQTITAWFRPALPSWTAEGVLFLWNGITAQYEVATPTLWEEFFVGSEVSPFQSVRMDTDTIVAVTSLLAIQRTAPTATLLVLPDISMFTGGDLKIVDFSTGVTNHLITLSPTGVTTIMRRTSYQLLSTADQLAGVTLHPSIDLNSWIIAP